MMPSERRCGGSISSRPAKITVKRRVLDEIILLKSACLRPDTELVVVQR